VVASILGCNHSHFSNSDIDIFIYGLTESQACEKIKSLWSALSRGKQTSLVVKTPNTLTFTFEYPSRHISCILRICDSQQQILDEFDVDCCAVLYDGNNVLASPRAIRAFTTRVNMVDLKYRSWAYEKRLLKV